MRKIILNIERFEGELWVDHHVYFAKRFDSIVINEAFEPNYYYHDLGSL